MANKESGSSGGALILQTMEDVMHQSMMPYAEYVILDRAIPRVEDGLKPVQRRILYTMMELGLTPDKPHRKSARIVGDCLGKYHPHGDSSVYEAMVRMAQDFNMQAPLVNGHGNFGSVDGDPAAAMRYTEARMTSLAMELLRDIEKDTVHFSLNFDDTMKEPDMLPGRFPNLLVNGASGIAVGLATNIPPHSLNESIDAAIAILQDPNVSLEKIMTYIKGPDFPTGGYLLDTSELKKAYETGKGRVVIRAKTHVETLKNGKKLIVIDELPYQVNKASSLEKILKLSEEKKTLFSAITDIRDESDRTGMRAIIELKRDSDADKVLAALYKYADLQINFSMNMVAIAKGKPQLMGLLEILTHYANYQKEVVTRRTRFDLEAAEKRAHILQGLIIAIDVIDKVIKLIRSSDTTSEARQKLMAELSITEIQAQAVLDMRLQRLVGLDIIELKQEYEKLQMTIAELKAILGDEAKLIAVIVSELKNIRKKYGVPRRTAILNESPVIEIENEKAIASEEAIVFMTATGIKRLSPTAYKKVSDEERVFFSIETSTDKRIQLFTNLGNMYSADVIDIPEMRGKERGIIPSGLFQGWSDGEKILAAYYFTEYREESSLLFFTASGMAKRTALTQYETRNKRIAACSLKEGDELISVALDNGNTSISCITKKGMSIRFPADSIPSTGRATSGVKAIQLELNDNVIFAEQVETDGELLVVSDRGYAKRSLLCDFDLQSRNGKGLKVFEFGKKGANGESLIAAFYVREPISIVAIQMHGEITSFTSEEVPIEHRNSKGTPILMALMDNTIVDCYKK